jgi:peptide/nickel transport system substrate-binding protein
MSSLRLAAVIAATLVSSAVFAQAPQRGGTLNAIVQPEPPLLVLGLNQQGPTQVVAGKIYQGLLAYDFDLKPKASLAKEWTISPDGLTYTFKLQDGVKWHDGKPFTSDDVIFSTKTFLMETHPRARGNFGRVAEFSAPDPQTVIFKLKEPFGPFIYAFEVSSAPMIPKHIYDGTDYRNNPANQTPIGTGPFKFKEWKKGDYIHLVRNDDYWKKGLPYLDEIYFRILPDAQSRLIAMESGQTQMASFGDIETVFMPQVRANPALEVTTKGYEFFAPLAWIDFNLRVKPFDDKRFRQAILYALDRDFIVKNIWFGQAKVATGPIASATRFYDANVPKYPLDVKKAEALLDEMGLKKGADGVRQRVKLLLLPYGETWVKLAEYVKQAVAKIGIEVTIESIDAGGWAQRASNWEFEMTFNFLYQYGDPALGVARSYITSNIRKGVLFTNTAGYSNAKVDELFEAAAKAVKDDERQKLYSEVQKILVEDVPIGWLVEIQFPTVLNKKLKNVVTTAIGVNETFDEVYMVK